MPDLIEQFCAHYHVYNNISAERRVEQTRVLREFKASAGDELGAGALRDYLGTLVAGGMAPSTVRKRLNMIRPYLTWLWQQKVIDGEALMELRDVAPPRGANGQRPNPYSRKQIEQFWRDLEVAYPWCRDGGVDRAEMFLKRWRAGSSKWPRVETYFMRCQVEAIVAIVLYGGARRDEAFNADPEDVHPENEYMVIRGARKNPDAEQENRPVPWLAGDQMRHAVGRWLALRDELAPPHDHLWLSLYRQHRLSPMSHRRFETLLLHVGRGYQYRRMRHTFATEALRAGMPLEQVSKIMGHRRLQQTLAYAKLVDSDVVRGAARVEANFSRAVGREAA